MHSGTVLVSNRLGLHARAAAQLVKLASSFKSEIKLSRDDGRISVNAKSILNVLTLAAVNGTTLQITADGEDEVATVEAIAELFARRFDEE
jgi:phosphotransferase system HPr (HPr) family protein